MQSCSERFRDRDSLDITAYKPLAGAKRRLVKRMNKVVKHWHSRPLRLYRLSKHNVYHFVFKLKGQKIGVVTCS